MCPSRRYSLRLQSTRLFREVCCRHALLCMCTVSRETRVWIPWPMPMLFRIAKQGRETARRVFHNPHFLRSQHRRYRRNGCAMYRWKDNAAPKVPREHRLPTRRCRQWQAWQSVSSTSQQCAVRNHRPPDLYIPRGCPRPGQATTDGGHRPRCRHPAMAYGP